MITLSPAVAGLFKGLAIVIIFAVVQFLSNDANLTGVLSPVIASLVAAIASAVESQMKASSGNTAALMGAVKLR